MFIKRLHQGFSLLELLICLSLLGILLVMALPSLQKPINKTKCLETQLLLLEAASYLDHYYAEHQSYRGADLRDLKLESELYHFELQLDAQNYQLRAVPQEKGVCASYVLGPEGLEEFNVY